MKSANGIKRQLMTTPLLDLHDHAELFLLDVAITIRIKCAEGSLGLLLCIGLVKRDEKSTWEAHSRSWKSHPTQMYAINHPLDYVFEKGWSLILQACASLSISTHSALSFSDMKWRKSLSSSNSTQKHHQLFSRLLGVFRPWRQEWNDQEKWKHGPVHKAHRIPHGAWNNPGEHLTIGGIEVDPPRRKLNQPKVMLFFAGFGRTSMQQVSLKEPGKWSNVLFQQSTNSQEEQTQTHSKRFPNATKIKRWIIWVWIRPVQQIRLSSQPLHGDDLSFRRLHRQNLEGLLDGVGLP